MEGVTRHANEREVLVHELDGVKERELREAEIGANKAHPVDGDVAEGGDKESLLDAPDERLIDDPVATLVVQHDLPVERRGRGECVKGGGLGRRIVRRRSVQCHDEEVVDSAVLAVVLAWDGLCVGVSDLEDVKADRATRRGQDGRATRRARVGRGRWTHGSLMLWCWLGRVGAVVAPVVLIEVFVATQLMWKARVPKEAVSV